VTEFPVVAPTPVQAPSQQMGNTERQSTAATLLSVASPLLNTASGFTQAFLQRVPSLSPWTAAPPVILATSDKVVAEGLPLNWTDGFKQKAFQPQSLKSAVIRVLANIAATSLHDASIDTSNAWSMRWKDIRNLSAELVDLFDELSEQEELGQTKFAVHGVQRLMEQLQLQSISQINDITPLSGFNSTNAFGLPVVPSLAHVRKTPPSPVDEDLAAASSPITAADALSPASGVESIDPHEKPTAQQAGILAEHALGKIENDAHLRNQHSDATPVSGLRMSHLRSLVHRPRRGLRILSLDGGGIRGMLMLECLKKLEADTGRQIHEMFDLIAGTSTGGLIAVSLCARKTLEEIAGQYENIRSAFGGQSAIMSEVKRFTTGTSHSHQAAEHVLKQYFSDVHMSSLPASPKCFVLCAAIDMAPAQPYLFRSYDLSHEAFAASEFLGTSSVFAHEAVRATTSAPTYYAPAIIGGQKMVDGAILQNNPTLIAVTEAMLLWPDTPVELVVSLGTGSQTPKPNNPSGVMAWVRTVLDLAMSSQFTHKLSAMLLEGRYFRLDPDGCGDYDLSEIRVDVLAKMLEDGRKYIQRHESTFDQITKVLKRGRTDSVQ
jgi:calcium-independent phospholipase A2-gamma